MSARSFVGFAPGPAAAVALAAGLLIGCGNSSGSEFHHGSGTGDLDATVGTGGDSGNFIGSGDGGGFFGGDGGVPVGSLTVSPSTTTLTVTIQNGVVTSTPLTFTASESGTMVQAQWSIDRGDVGSIGASTGVFTASGAIAGAVTVTANYGNSTGAATVTVQIASTENGGTPFTGDAGAGGYGGVGGEGPGGPTDAGAFGVDASAPASAAELGFLYPYDGTVWPRGLLAPLLQWQTTHTATAAYIHLYQQDFDFKGYYALPAGAASSMRQPINQQAWDQATHSNEGDPLHVELTISAADGVIGPIAESWTIAPAILQGTVYYASYNSALNQENGSSVTGAVLAIQPGSTAPTLAVPALKGRCHVCHEVSANGSTLYTNDDYSLNYDSKDAGFYEYGFGGSYDLTDGGAQIKRYDLDAAVGGLTPADVVGKYTYSGVYPDGTFVLANAYDNFHAYQGASNLFDRSTLLPIASTGFTSLVSQAVTPSFSPDGKHVAFNFAGGQSGVDAGVAPGTGSLKGNPIVAMDFDCGSTSGSVTCGAPPYQFSGMRQVYQDPTRWAGWPAFTPDGNSVLLQSSITASTGGSPLNTYEGGTAELWIADTRATPLFAPQQLCALNGYASDCKTPYLPVVPNHPNDTIYNYEPTVNPVSTGGYYWVVFTSRRAYGNVAQGAPYEGNAYVPINHPITKKLWVAAVDPNVTGGVDPSHPAFYLPGQELNAGDMKGSFVVSPCHADGTSCQTGDQCCHGFCREPADGGALACTSVVTGCSNEYEHCVTSSDCCDVAQGYMCVNGLCARPPTR